MEMFFRIGYFLMLGVFLFPVNETRANSFQTRYDPPDVLVTESRPYYFHLMLPDWDYSKDQYTRAIFELSYVDQCYTDIFVFAADPETGTSMSSNYDILLGTVPHTTRGASGTAEFNLLTALDPGTFEALFLGLSELFLVADCHYYFDKASVHLEASTVPLPTAWILFFSGLAGLGRIKKNFRS